MGAEGFAGLAEEGAEVLGVLLLFLVEVVLELFDLRIGIEAHIAHGLLGLGIDIREDALGLLKGLAGTLAAFVFLFGLAEFLAEEALEEIALRFGGHLGGLGFKVVLQLFELLHGLLILLFEVAEAGGDEGETLHLRLGERLAGLHLVFEAVEVAERGLVALEDVVELLRGGGQALALALAHGGHGVVVLRVDRVDGLLMLRGLVFKGTLHLLIALFESLRVLAFEAGELGTQRIIIRAGLEQEPAQHSRAEQGDNKQRDEVFDRSHDKPSFQRRKHARRKQKSLTKALSEITSRRP